MKQRAADGDFVEGFVAEGMLVFEVEKQIESIAADLPIAEAAVAPLREISIQGTGGAGSGSAGPGSRSLITRSGRYWSRCTVRM